MERIIGLSKKVLPFVYAAGGKLEWDLAQANTPLVKGSLTLKLETPVPQMLLDAIKARWQKKPQEHIQEDDGYVLISELDFESEVITFVELTREFEEMIVHEANEAGCNNSDPAVIEYYVELMLGKSAGDADGVDVEPAEQTDGKMLLKVTMDHLIKQGHKLLSIVCATGGKFDWDLVEAQSPLLKVSLTLKLEVPLANMLIDALTKQKPPDEITSNDDSWLLILNLDSQTESELTQEFDEAQEGNRTGDYGSAKKSEPTDKKRDEVELLISNLDLKGGISTTCAEKDYVVVPVHAENKDDVGVQTAKEEELGAGKPEESHAAAE